MLAVLLGPGEVFVIIIAVAVFFFLMGRSSGK